MIKNSKLMTTVLILIFGIIAISPAQADINDIINAGIGYLEANQDAESDLWGTDKETPYRDGAVVVDVLARIKPTSENIESGFQAVYSMSTISTDYLARKIIAQASVNDGFVTPDLVTSLVDMQNTDGGWGYQKHYVSNVLETALAIKALVAASYVDPDPSVLTPAGTFLANSQNNPPPLGDYGWGFVSGSVSRVLYTAHAVTALSALQDNYTGYDFSDQIDDAFVWLDEVQLNDDGFGSDGTSNAYETGLAIAAMIAFDPAAQNIADAWGYLESTQDPTDGSWDDDAYSTAMAIDGLNCIDPTNFFYAYLPGDANMYNGDWPPMVLGGDVTYLMNFFRGLPTSPSCLLDGYYCSADANGDCMVIGSDITRLINYFRGYNIIEWCSTYEPAWLPPPADPPSGDAPEGWPNCDTPSVTSKSLPTEIGK
ncbi:MAG: terpene cyclase/mutase family protein [candidate division Zixibacteria bacterium]|nr:terpene cyclase/mutase family protein [candidate division Zixibacteria bacterium]